MSSNIGDQIIDERVKHLKTEQRKIRVFLTRSHSSLLSNYPPEITKVIEKYTMLIKIEEELYDETEMISEEESKTYHYSMVFKEYHKGKEGNWEISDTH